MKVGFLTEPTLWDWTPFVEATEAGYEMYKAAGFITVDDFWADAKTETPTEEWKGLKEEL